MTKAKASKKKTVISPAEQVAVLSSVNVSSKAVLQAKQKQAFGKRFNSLIKIYNQAAASNPFDALDNIRRSIYREAQRYDVTSLSYDQKAVFHDSVVIGLARFQQYLFNPLRDNSFDGDPVAIGPGDRVDYDIALKTHDFFKDDDLLSTLVHIMAPQNEQGMTEFFEGTYPHLTLDQLETAFVIRINVMKEVFRMSEYFYDMRKKFNNLNDNEMKDAAYHMMHVDQIAANFFPEYSENTDKGLQLFDLSERYWTQLYDVLEDYLKPAVKLYQSDIKRSQANLKP